MDTHTYNRSKATEDAISLKAATKLRRLHRDGKRPHVATIYRWATVGCRGVILESWFVGQARCTSEQAIIRFLDRLSAGLSLPADAPTPRERDRQIEAAEHRLAAAGI